MPSARSTPSPLASASTSRSPVEKSVQALVTQILPDAVADTLRPLGSSRPHRLYHARLSDGRAILLVLPPPSACRLLRSETTLLESEATLVWWMHRTVLSPTADSDGGLMVAEARDGTRQRLPFAERNLTDFVPSLLGHCRNATEPSCSYNLFEPVRGAAMAKLSPSLAPLERLGIQRQAGWLVRRLSTLTSPSGDFGPVEAVLSASPTSPTLGIGEGKNELEAGRGVIKDRSWAKVFRLMLEEVLRDAEDMAVMLAFSAVRWYIQQLGHVLDGVTIPRLVVVSGIGDENIMVGKVEGGGHCIRGLHDWGGCVFGDPLFASVFSRDPSADFLCGFNGVDQPGTPGGGVLWDPSLVEDVDHAEIRLLFYDVYHTVFTIVREIYRPRRNSTARELEARTRLGWILQRLQDVADRLGVY